MLRQLWAFFWASGLAVLLDLVLFSVLVSVEVAPWIANIVSSALAVTVTYTLVTRYAFGASARWTSYALFVGWYALSIFAFSMLVQWAHSGWGWHEIFAKLASLPFSFGVNYLFSRWLFSRRWLAPGESSA